ncbi:helix-turn-helix transcriptional regulator [Paenibacillus hemerocallicola]|uniref:Helix-turn-helix transcriptional regulator n=1 Tax=Paenibacillus hemerocallicola TaxID=1172614 RepID=A0A5C4T872_9BACL|nr:AraC family transcriptional regulator [Paenibacillus hemerocallicola]TNJ65221.1 helix-turn-helix transcriptional regulator [Paenibacillus hemerocallicola]
MDAQALWNRQPQLAFHFYFERKEQFEMKEDTYPVWVIFAVESGKFRFRIDSESGEASAGDLIYCPPGRTFHREMVSPLGLHYIGFEFADGQQSEPKPLPPSVKSHPTDGKRLFSDFAYLRKLHHAVDPRSVQRKQMILGDIWQLTCEDWEDEHLKVKLEHLPDSEDELMNRATEWLSRHAYTPFGMSELSSLLGLSPVQFTRRFRKSFQMTPSEFVRSVRIRKAAELLLETDMTLDQIASRCGYENAFYLSLVFAKSMGRRPSKYREMNRV